MKVFLSRMQAYGPMLWLGPCVRELKIHPFYIAFSMFRPWGGEVYTRQWAFLLLREFLDYLSDFHLLMRNYTPWDLVLLNRHHPHKPGFKFHETIYSKLLVIWKENLLTFCTATAHTYTFIGSEHWKLAKGKIGRIFVAEFLSLKPVTLYVAAQHRKAYDGDIYETNCE
jgi:hypothetical protein